MKINLTPPRIGKLRPKSSEFTVWDAATPHFGIRVSPTGSMRFIHLAPVEGKLKKRTIGDARVMTLVEARAIAREIDSGEEINSKPCPLFSEWVDTWWEQARTRLKPRTQSIYQALLKNQLLPALGNVRLDTIDQSAVLPWFERFSRSSPGNANRALSLLSSILNSAKKADIIPTNPVRRIHRNPRRIMTRFLDSEERDRLLTEIEALPPRHRTKGMVVKLLLSTGCRLGEILSLKWAEVGDGVLNLADSKTGARRVWLGPEAAAILDEVRGLKNVSEGSEFVFPSSANQRNRYANFHRFWWKLRAEVGIPDVRLHDLRHSFASEAVRQGVALPVVSKLLGHSDIKMTLRYTHASNKELEEAAERIGKRLNNLLTG